MTSFDKIKQNIWNFIYKFFLPLRQFLLKIGIVWHKKGTDKSDFATCELIYSSMNRAGEYFKYDWVGFGYINNSNKDKDKKEHPTQKPLKLLGYFGKKDS